MPIRLSTPILVTILTSWSVAAPPSPTQHFNTTIAPLLAHRCLDCHSGHQPKGNLNLATRASSLKGGESGPAITPNKPTAGLFWKQVTSNKMPPKHPLPDSEKKILLNWLKNGAQWGDDPIDPFRFTTTHRAGYDFWSLQPLQKHNRSIPQDNTQSQNPIDDFILAKLKSKNLTPSPRANPRTLVRRLYFNLIGLPPPPHIIAKFANNPSQTAWTKLVNNLLNSPHYGERWAQHWLDVARFGETHGYEYNEPRNHAWHYRDWLIRSLNNDLPYNRFAAMQIAGDIIKPNSLEGAASVGFLVAGIHNTVLGTSEIMKRSARQDELEEIAGTLAQTFLGLTLNCARCHDHKFDPISAKEYYQFISALDAVTHGTKSIPSKQLNKLQQKHDNLQKRLVNLITKRNPHLSSNANRITLNNPISANQENTTYTLSLKLAPTTWASPTQATSNRDGILIQILRNSKTLTFHHLKPAPWNHGKNATNFATKSFTWKGDGTGPIIIRISPFPLNSNRFGAAIDDLTIKSPTRIIFQDNFNNLTQTHPPGRQARTSLKVFHSAVSKFWKHSGLNAIHAVQHADNNFALQLFSGNATPINLTPQTPTEKSLQSQINAIRNQITQIHKQSPTTIFTVIPKPTPPMRIYHRGDAASPGPAVTPAGLKAIVNHAPSFSLPINAPDSRKRLKLAQWVTHKNNALFHRTIVNRIWHYHFGRGIVDSPNDLGFNGARPTHPKLLDFLANYLRSNNYSLKKLHRLILTSVTYQQSSATSSNPSHKTASAIDKQNTLLWRQNPRRIDAEAFRDSILQISGTLNPKQFGPPYIDVKTQKVGVAHYYLSIDPVGKQFNRRTIYRWHARGQRSAILDTFDCPDPSTTTPKRNITTTPSQTLSQWNHPFILRMAKHLAARIQKQAGPEPAKQISLAFQLTLGRAPTPNESKSAASLIKKHNLPLLTRVLFNANEFIWIE